MSASAERCLAPRPREWNTWLDLACAEACCVAWRGRKTIRLAGRYYARLCRTLGADQRLSLQIALQSERQTSSDQPASRVPRSLRPHRRTLRRNCEGKVENHSRAYLGHGSDREPLPKVALQMPART